MHHIPSMQTRSTLIRWLLPTLVGLLLVEVHAGVWNRRVQYRYGGNRNIVRPPPTNQPARPKPAEPVEKPVKFRDIAINTKFYFVADKDRKLFPRVKVSETMARSVPTAANPRVTTNALPADTFVIVKKESPNKGAQKQEPEKKRPDGAKDGKKP
jgi:hypothetical protein